MRQYGTSPCDLAFQAEGGDPEAQYQLGVLFLLGDQVEQDPNAASRWLAMAASAQHAGAQSLLDKVAEWRAAEAPSESLSRSCAPNVFIAPLALAQKLVARAAMHVEHGTQALRGICSRWPAVRIRIPDDVHDSLSFLRRRKVVQPVHPS